MQLMSHIQLVLSFPGGSDGLPAMWETQVPSLSWEDPLEKEMAAHSSTLAWKIPWTEKSQAPLINCEGIRTLGVSIYNTVVYFPMVSYYRFCFLSPCPIYSAVPGTLADMKN